MQKNASSSSTKNGPGEYRPDGTFARMKDLPKPKSTIESRTSLAPGPLGAANRLFESMGSPDGYAMPAIGCRGDRVSCTASIHSTVSSL